MITRKTIFAIYAVKGFQIIQVLMKTQKTIFVIYVLKRYPIIQVARLPVQPKQSVNIVGQNMASLTAAIIQAVRKSEEQKMQHARKKATQVIHTARDVEQSFPQEQLLIC